MGLAGCHLSSSVSDRPCLKEKTVESDSRMPSCGLHACLLACLRTHARTHTHKQSHSSEAGVVLNLDLSSQLLLCHLTSFTASGVDFQQVPGDV